jgi:hypothetical protein
MIKRFGLGFAIGYVVGARTGQDRYDQLVAAGRKVLDIPAVRDAVAQGEDRARQAGRRVLSSVRSSLLEPSGDDAEDEWDSDEDEEDDGDDADESATGRLGDDADDVDTDAEETDDADSGRSRRRNRHGSSPGRADGERGAPSERRPARSTSRSRAKSRDGSGSERSARRPGGQRHRGSGRRTPDHAGRKSSGPADDGRHPTRSSLAKVAKNAVARGRTD